MEVLWAAILLVITLILYMRIGGKKILEQRKIIKAIDLLPGDKCYPIIGTTLRAIKAGRKNFFKDVIKMRHKIHGPISRSWLGSLPVVNIYKAEHIEIILKSNVNIRKSLFYRYLEPMVGQGLVLLHGDNWKHHRRLITPAFHFNILDKYSEIFSQKAKTLVTVLEEKLGQGYFDIVPYLTMCTMDIVCETAMGIEHRILETKSCEYADAIEECCNAIIRRIYNPFYQSDFIYRLTDLGKKDQRNLTYIHDYTRKIVEKRKSEFKNKAGSISTTDSFGRKQKMAFLDILLQNSFTDQEIIDEVTTFVSGGQDTSAFTMVWTLFCLANNPLIQDKVHEELDIVIGRSEKPITYQDVASLDYLERVIKEAHRHYTPIPTLGRILDEDIKIDKYVIPKGVSVMISLWDTHHDPDQFPDPYKFDPDRFLPDEVAKRHPYSYVPFSAGPRNCIGQKFAMRSVKIVLAYLLQKYRVKCLETPETIDCYVEIVIRPQNGLHVELELRH